MTHAEGTFGGAFGLELSWQSWRPETEPRAALVIVHGFGEHSGRYMNVVNHLLPLGYAVHAFDHRGHGRSPGQRGHIDEWAQFRGDVGAFLRFVGEREPSLPLFLMGHSLGGLIVLEFVLHSPEGIRGAIASGPALAQVGISPALLALGRVMSHIWPKFALDTKLDANLISRDPSVVKVYRDDPLVHSRASARLGAELERAMAWTHAHASGWRTPLLILHGGGDRLVPAQGSRAFFEKIPFPDKELHVYEGGYHEPHNDLQRAEVLADLAGWLERHL